MTNKERAILERLEAFDWAAHEPATWRMWSMVLWRAATATWPASQRVAMMLSGLAIENRLKALWILQKHRRGVTSGGRLSDDLRTHELNTIATRASIPLAKEERALCDRLSHFVVWAGRYPIPKSARENRQIEVGPNDRKAVRALYDRLKTEFSRLEELEELES